MGSLDELARQEHAFEAVDTLPFQRKARVLQSLWRKQQDYPIGMHRGRPLGSRLEEKWAKKTLKNFLTDEIRQVVREEVLDPRKSEGKLYGKPRIFNDLLSSQPMAFNLFAVPSRSLPLATSVFRQLTGGRCHEVTGIEFEHSPGRGDPRYLDDHSAFDVYVAFLNRQGGRGFIGIEVKYHENLANPASKHHDRYDKVADKIEWFLPTSRARLKAKPLQQIWRDHLLAGSLLLADGFADGFFVMLSPQANTACEEAIHAYRECLTSSTSFEHWTLESVVATIRQFTNDAWITGFEDRYLSFGKLDQRQLP